MCVRTKTSYGCGCEYKTDADCHLSRCSGLERYHYPRSGDCKTCKDAGHALTRGRDGRGRYGQEMHRRTQSPQEEFESPVETSPDTADVGNGISPWGAPSTRERDWISHSRRKADDAWLEEHSERNFDLQSIREVAPSDPPSERNSPVNHSPRRREARIYICNDDLSCDREDRHRRRHRREDSGRSLPVEIVRVRDDYDRPLQHTAYRRRRQDSQESFESMPSSRSSTRKYRPGPASYATHEYAEPQDSGYGSYGSRASDGYGRAQTEPYHYASSRVASVKPSSPQPYSSLHTGYGIGPVSVIRAPAYGYSSRR